MCKEVVRTILRVDVKTVEMQLALHCAPMITGLKISNLLMLDRSLEASLKAVLRHTGILYFRLGETNGKTAFLLFRRGPMEEHLRDSNVRDILLKCGYQDFSIGNILLTFQKRYQTCMDQGADFPHEMGVLLGYSWEDVIGFVENQGKDSLYTGYWKVYHNLAEKLELFRKYDDAQRDLIRLLTDKQDIRSILEIYKEQSPKMAAV